MVLVVDDSKSMRDLISACLVDAGCEVITAENGWQGCVLAEEHLPDLIVSDVEMPEVDGFGLLSHLRENPRLALTPIIMLTRLTDRSSVRRAMSLGAEDFLFKPLDLDVLVDAVQTQLTRHRSRKAASSQLDEHMVNLLGTVLPHEFRTPLNVILGYGELLGALAEDGLTQDTLEEFSREIVQAGRHLLSQTNRFITLSHLIGDQAQANASDAKAEVDVAVVKSVAEEAISLAAPQVTVPLDMSVDNAVLACETKAVRDALFELVGNAAKFADRGTPITVTGKHAADGDYVFAIENTGLPFPLEQIPAIGAFRQFDRHLFEQQGVGIGLEIVTMVARIWHGRFEVENLPQGVVRVTLRLPVVVPEASQVGGEARHREVASAR